MSNDENFLGGGLIDSVIIGTDRAVLKEVGQSLTLQLTVAIIYLLHSVYAFFIFFTGKRKRQKQFLYYGLLVAISALAILIDDDVVLQLPGNIQVTHHILWILFMSNLLLIPIVIRHLFRIQTRYIRFIFGMYIVLVTAFVVLPFAWTPYVMPFIGLFYLASFVFILKHTFLTLRKGHNEAVFILLWIASYVSNITWGILIQSGGLNIPYYPFDFIISLVVMVLLLFRQHQHVVQLNDQQTAQLQEADQKKDEFLANTSHELRNPLRGIITIAQTLLRDEESQLAKKNRQSLELLVSVGQRMTLLLNDLLDVRRLHEGVIRLDRKSVRIQGVVSGVFDLMRYLTTGKPIVLQMKISDDFPAVFADENRIIQVLFNLIHNALKYTESGLITVEATCQKKMAVVTVTDTGAGLSEEMMRKVFLPYEQQESTASACGLGLGLAICKDLVELHGGEMTVTSTVGQGTTFAFTLPLASAVERAEVVRQVAVTTEDFNETKRIEIENPVVTGKKARILLVDDDPVNLQVVHMLLDPHYAVTTAVSGKEALAKIEKFEWDLVISDVMMPNMSGYELTRHIRKLYTLSELPVLLLTARSRIEDITAGFDAGANDYVSKPVDTVELQARVESLIGLKRSIYEQLRMEAAWLQAQIQPHFLFNTLNTIAALAEIDSVRMMRLLEEFANYLRKSFDVTNTSSLVSLEEELDLTRSYVYIEQQRFGERLQVEWAIDEQIEIEVPPLSIQPLVENAIRHGVLKRIEGGTVVIRVQRHADYTEISIVDDGVGMTSDKANALMHGYLLKEEYGIGITNTNRRCKQLFGSGLQINSVEGKGTTISFRVPHEVKIRD